MTQGYLPICEAIHDEVISLPAGSHIGLFQVEKVFSAIREFFQ